MIADAELLVSETVRIDRLAGGQFMERNPPPPSTVMPLVRLPPFGKTARFKPGRMAERNGKEMGHHSQLPRPANRLFIDIPFGVKPGAVKEGEPKVLYSRVAPGLDLLRIG